MSSTEFFSTYVGGLPAAGSVGPTDQLYVLQSGNSLRATILQIAAAAGGSLVINNVKSFGATGNGVTDDTDAIQDAVDASFGTAASPNGVASEKNIPLYFPPGTYVITSPIVLTRVQGGLIFGSGRFTTSIFNTAGGGCFATNGFSYCTVRDLALQTEQICVGKGQLFNLSNSNLTVVRRYNVDTYHQQFVRSVASNSTGKFYCELVVTKFVEATFQNSIIAFGVGNSTPQTVSGTGTTPFLGADNNSIAYRSDLGNVTFNGVGSSTLAAATQADTIGMAVDLGTGLAWFRINGGNWNGSGLANPATAIGGVSFLISGACYVYYGTVFDTLSTVTANFGATAYNFTAPVGFGNWGGGTPTSWDETTVAQQTVFDLDWDGTGAVTLQENIFENVYFSGGDYGLRIGVSGSMGSENICLECFFDAQDNAGLVIENFNALGNQVYGGNVQACYYGVHVNAGSVPIINTQFQQSIIADIQVESSANDTYQINSRTESTYFCNFIRGTSVVSACLQSGVANLLPGASQSLYINDPALLVLQSTYWGGASLHTQMGIGTVGASASSYFEVTVTNCPTFDGEVGIGIGNAVNGNYGGVNGFFLGADTNGIGYYDDGTVKLNGSTVTTIQTFAQGNVIGVAFDTTHNTIWFRVNGGNWNNSGAANPATNTGGISFASLYTLQSGLALFACVNLSSTDVYGTTFTATFSAPFAHTAPAGFSALGGTWSSGPQDPPLFVSSGNDSTTIIGCVSNFGYVDAGNPATIINSQIGLTNWTLPFENEQWNIDNLQTGQTYDGSGFGNSLLLRRGLWISHAYTPLAGSNESVIVANLPAAGVKGRRYFVTDATATTFQSIVAGTGSDIVPVFDDGTNWRIG